MDDVEEDLDTSWMAEKSKQLWLSSKINYERELMEEIRVFFVYIDADGALEKITKEVETVGRWGISKERILHLIQSKRHLPHRGRCQIPICGFIGFSYSFRTG
jgi:hypothetical protein